MEASGCFEIFFPQQCSWHKYKTPAVIPRIPTPIKAMQKQSLSELKFIDKNKTVVTFY